MCKIKIYDLLPSSSRYIFNLKILRFLTQSMNMILNRMDPH
jgi:hypothetical protein